MSLRIAAGAALALGLAIQALPAQAETAQEAANKAVALGYIDVVWNQHKPVEGYAKYVDPKSTHYPGKPGDANPEGLAKFQKGFPNFHYDVKLVLTQGDYVMVHSLLSGVPGVGAPVNSPQPGAQPAPKTGDQVVDIFRIKDGKIVQHWDVVEAVTGDGEAQFK